MYLTNEKWITSFKGHELVKVEKNIENASWKLTAFKVMKCYIALILQKQTPIQPPKNHIQLVYQEKNTWKIAYKRIFLYNFHEAKKLRDSCFLDVVWQQHNHQLRRKGVATRKQEMNRYKRKMYWCSGWNYETTFSCTQ